MDVLKIVGVQINADGEIERRYVTQICWW
jgi:hypothetical protein